MESYLGQLLDFMLGKNFILVTLFVVTAMEFFIKPRLKNSTLYPYIALLLSITGVALLRLADIGEWKSWLLEGIVQAFLVDIFYTFFGKPAFIGMKAIWEFFLKKLENKENNP